MELVLKRIPKVADEGEIIYIKINRQAISNDNENLEDIGPEIYKSLINKISNDMEVVVKDVEGNVIEKVSALDKEFSLSYKVNEDRLYITKNFVDVIEIKKDGEFLVKLLDFIDDSMRG